MCQAVIDLEKTKSRFLLNKNSTRLWTFFPSSSFGLFLRPTLLYEVYCLKHKLIIFSELSFCRRLKFNFGSFPPSPCYPATTPLLPQPSSFEPSPIHPPDPPDLKTARSSHLIRYLMLIKYNFEKV